MGSALIFIILGLGYAIGKVWLEKRLAPKENEQNGLQLENLAFARGCSVYDIFQAAGVKWNFSHFKLDQDFKSYLGEGFVPAYVHEYCRHDYRANDRTYQEILFSGGRPPYL